MNTVIAVRISVPVSGSPIVTTSIFPPTVAPPVGALISTRTTPVVMVAPTGIRPRGAQADGRTVTTTPRGRRVVSHVTNSTPESKVGEQRLFCLLLHSKILLIYLRVI